MTITLSSTFLWDAIDDRIRTAVRFGWLNAHKHTTPDDDTACERIGDEIMGALADMLLLDEPLATRD